MAPDNKHLSHPRFSSLGSQKVETSAKRLALQGSDSLVGALDCLLE